MFVFLLGLIGVMPNVQERAEGVLRSEKSINNGGGHNVVAIRRAKKVNNKEEEPKKKNVVEWTRRNK